MLEFVDGVTLAGFAAEESIKALKERVAVKMDVIAIGSGVIVVSAANLVTLVVVTNNEDIEGVLEVVGITIETNGITVLDITECIKFTEDVIKFVKLGLLAVGPVAIVKEGFLFCWKVSVGTGTGAGIDIAVAAGTGSVGE